MRPTRLSALSLWLLLTVAAGVPASALAAPLRARGPATAPALPESVLAQVGHGTGRSRVTAREVHAAAVKFGADPGALTSEQAREIVDALVDQRLLRAAVAREPRLWSAADSAEYRALAEQLAFETARDSAFASERARRAARGDTVFDPGALGAALRDSAMARLQPSYDDALLSRLAAAFDAIPRPLDSDDLLTRAHKLAGMPAVAAGDTDLTLASLEGRPYTVRDLLGRWKALRALQRPHLADARQLKDLANTELYERLLRARSASGGRRLPSAAAARLRERAEFLDVRSWTVRHVYALIPRDSLTLRREFDRDPARWDLPAHAAIVRLEFATRTQADSAARALRSAGAAAVSSRAREDAVIVDARTDSAFTARCVAAGAGAVLGPESSGASAWSVVRVTRAEPRRASTFAEARARVDRDWFDREGETRLRATLDGLRRELGVTTNEDAIRRLGGR